MLWSSTPRPSALSRTNLQLPRLPAPSSLSHNDSVRDFSFPKSSSEAGVASSSPTRLYRFLPGRLYGCVPLCRMTDGDCCAGVPRVMQVSYSLRWSWRESFRKPVLNLKHPGILKLSRSLVNYSHSSGQCSCQTGST